MSRLRPVLLACAALAAVALAARQASAMPPPTPQKQKLAPVKALMEEKINPSVTTLSFHLYHSKNGDQLTPEVMDALVQLSETATGLVRNADKYTDDPAFRLYAIQLQTSVQGMIDAYGGQEDTAAISHWFTHVRSTCNSCHTTFRD